VVFNKPNQELKLAMKRQTCVKTMSQMKALGILGSLLLKNHMVRCLSATEALLLLPRGARRAVLPKGVLNEWAGLLAGLPYKNVHTLSADIPRHSAHGSNFSDMATALHCSHHHPKLTATQRGERNTFNVNKRRFLDFP